MESLEHRVVSSNNGLESFLNEISNVFVSGTGGNWDDEDEHGVSGEFA